MAFGQPPYNYYQPGNQGYGKSSLFGDHFTQTPVGQQFWNNNQTGAFTRWLSEKGVPQQSKFGQWAGNQLQDIQRGFTAAQGDNPELSFYGPQQSYLNTIDLNSIYKGLPFQQRGESPQLFSTRARMLPRGQ